jgi:hypothetical protein
VQVGSASSSIAPPYNCIPRLQMQGRGGDCVLIPAGSACWLQLARPMQVTPCSLPGMGVPHPQPRTNATTLDERSVVTVTPHIRSNETSVAEGTATCSSLSAACAPTAKLKSSQAELPTNGLHLSRRKIQQPGAFTARRCHSHTYSVQWHLISRSFRPS